MGMRMKENILRQDLPKIFYSTLSMFRVMCTLFKIYRRCIQHKTCLNKYVETNNIALYVRAAFSSTKELPCQPRRYNKIQTFQRYISCRHNKDMNMNKQIKGNASRQSIWTLKFNHSHSFCQVNRSQRPSWVAERNTQQIKHVVMRLVVDRRVCCGRSITVHHAVP